MREQKLERLLDLVREMRESQTEYFKSKPNSPERYNLLVKSKQREANLDQLVQELDTKQTDLFNDSICLHERVTRPSPRDPFSCSDCGKPLKDILNDIRTI